MTPLRPDSPEMDRLLDLLADRTLGALDPSDAAELAGLLAAHPEFDDQSMDAAAASASLAMCPRDPETMPATLRQRLLGDADRFAASGAHGAGKIGQVPAPDRRGSFAWFPWLLAAASIALAAAVWVARPGAAPGPPTPTLAERLDDFTKVHAPADLKRLAWAGQPDPLVSEGLTGEVYWSQSRQRGYMVFSGLRRNDPAREQYQLWIFDGSREHPVDGGVFDVAADGAVIVPIDAKLPVREPTLFAVTVEKPGGVVVSKKERIAVVAPVEQG